MDSLYIYCTNLEATKLILNLLEGHKQHNKDEIEDQAPYFKPILIGDLCQGESGAEKRIIFIETSGYMCLQARQACAVESAALTNPDMTIYLYMSLFPPLGNPEEVKGEGLERHCQTTDILMKLSNVKIIQEDLNKYFIGTPLEQLVTDGIFKKSNFSYHHMSDALRIALLYRFGGIYLDLDVIVFRSLRCLRNMAGHVTLSANDAASSDESIIENGVLIFDKGHEFLNFFMNVMLEIYDPSNRLSIGPYGITDAVKLFCNLQYVIKFEELGELLQCKNNSNITLMYTEAFYSIDYFHHVEFFKESFKISELEKFETSFLSHIYCATHGTSAPQTSLYNFFAERFCPTVRNLKWLWHETVAKSNNKETQTYNC